MCVFVAMDKNELMTLYDILMEVGGSPTESRRKYAKSVLEKIRDLTHHKNIDLLQYHGHDLEITDGCIKFTNTKNVFDLYTAPLNTPLIVTFVGYPKPNRLKKGDEVQVVTNFGGDRYVILPTPSQHTNAVLHRPMYQIGLTPKVE